MIKGVNVSGSIHGKEKEGLNVQQWESEWGKSRQQFCWVGWKCNNPNIYHQSYYASSSGLAALTTFKMPLLPISNPIPTLLCTTVPSSSLSASFLFFLLYSIWLLPPLLFSMPGIYMHAHVTLLLLVQEMTLLK